MTNFALFDSHSVLLRAQIIKDSFHLSKVNTLCLLRVLLFERCVQCLFERIEVEWTQISDEVDFILLEKTNNEHVELRNGGDEECNAEFLDILSYLNEQIKIKDPLNNVAYYLLLTLLKHPHNEAKTLLNNYEVTYKKMCKAIKNLEINDDFSFPGEDDLPEPNDSSARGKGFDNKQMGKLKDADDNETPMLDNFGTDLTNIALKGGLDPVVGRNAEIQRITQILCRRKKNNPIIIGEPGVGKSAIVEGLAERIAHHQVPQTLLNKRIVALDMATIVAGTQYRGQFEERLRRLIKELKAHPEVILFIDEIHTIIGAGSAPGSLDAANILKPTLARGEVQCIGATTVGEFKKSIEKDGALERRFQKILMEPTSIDDTLTILHNLRKRYEQHHNVTYTEEALKACVELTNRYITDRALPDKAIDALDEVGARVHLSSMGTPDYIEKKQKEINQKRQDKLQAAQEQDYERAANLRDEVQTLTIELEYLTNQWKAQQNEHPVQVDSTVVAQVVSMMSGVPATRIASDENKRLKDMRRTLEQKVIAQNEAIEKITRAITRNRLGLKGNDHPIGIFLFVGPTGVGKTHLVKCLAEWMFGTKDSLIRIDMSEYGEKYSVSRLVGAPPGYVGYEEGGQLTEKVRRHPYSVILLDEIEKAHPDVFNTLLQVMDEGRMTDGNGVTVDFRNAIIILTSNSGTRQLKEFGNGLGFERITNQLTKEMTESIIQKALSKQFAPEFLNRLDNIIVFNSLKKEDASLIASIEINKLKEEMQKQGYTLQLTDDVLPYLVDKGFNAQYGARSLKRSIQHHLEDALCDFIMEHEQQTSFTASIEEGKVHII